MSAIPVPVGATLLDLSADQWEEVTLGLRWRDIVALRCTCRSLREVLADYLPEHKVRGIASIWMIPTLRGVRHGIMRFCFYAKYTRDVPYRDGKQHGLAVERDVDGAIIGTMPYKEGLLHGRSWVQTRLRHRPNMVFTQIWYEGERHGPHRRFTADGTLEYMVTYTRGELHGPAEFHFPPTNPVFGNGALLVGCYDHDKAHGTVRVLDKHGVAVASARYDRGVFVEDWVLADSSNTLPLEVLYRDAQRCASEWPGVVAMRYIMALSDT